MTGVTNITSICIKLKNRNIYQGIETNLPLKPSTQALNPSMKARVKKIQTR